MLQPPKPPHGRRLLISHIEHRARTEPNAPWVAVPVDEDDLTKGYKDITWSQFRNGVNHTAHWLKANLPASAFSQPFQSFAYVGPKDLRYPFLVVAAGKLGLVVVLPSSSVTAEGRQRILAQKQCTIFLHGAGMEAPVDEVVNLDSSVKAIVAPPVTELLSPKTAAEVPYNKTWEEGKDDPWLCFHTSGTTGYPKVITYSQRMLGIPDSIAGLENIRETHVHHFANRRYFLPMPMLHYVGLYIILSCAAFINTIPVLLPANAAPIPSVIKAVFKHTKVDSAILVPALIDALVEDAEAVDLLKGLQSMHYAGAPLSINAGRLLSPHVRIVPAIGSTDAGAYFIELVNTTTDWDYVSFQPHAGVVLEPRVDDMHELVFVRNPDCCSQPVFGAYPGLDRFETKDLWIEHPTKKGQWKIVGRTDDYLFLQHGDGLYVAPLELTIEEHPGVTNAVIGGQGRPVPVIVVELTNEALKKAGTPDGRIELVKSLRPNIERINGQVHEMVRLDPELVVFASRDRPFPRTVKDTVSRINALKMYDKEIAEAYENAGYKDKPRM